VIMRREEKSVIALWKGVHIRRKVNDKEAR
jgi:hypothetical protein